MRAVTVDRQPGPDDLFDHAIQRHLAGDLRAAVPLYERLLQASPRRPDLLDLYGTALFQLGRAAAGRPFVAASTQARPGYGPAWNHLGVIDRALKRDASAWWAFRRSSVLDPGRMEALVNLAGICGDLGRLDEGLELAARALAAAPTSQNALLRQGVLLRRAGRPVDALPYLSAAWRCQLGHVEAGPNLARVHAELGNPVLARRIVRSGILLSPQADDFYCVPGASACGEDSSGRAWAARSVILRPLRADAWQTVGAEAFGDGDIHRAQAAFRRGTLLDPTSATALHNLAAVAFAGEALDACRDLCRRALTARPDDADTLYTLSKLAFRAGETERGWLLHEARLRREAHRPRLNLPPVWQGPGTETGPLLIAAEQGVGDEVTFLACLPDLYGDFAKPVVIEVDRRLVPLVARTFPLAQVVARQLVPGDGLGPVFDYRSLTERCGLHHVVSCGSLPMHLKREGRPLDRGGYLRTDPERVDQWQRWLSSLGTGVKTGMVWRTAQRTRLRDRVHCRIEDLMPLLATPGCIFINLMADDTVEERAKVKAATGVEMVTPPGLDLWNDLDGLAALMRALDVVVAGRTANCAFAGAVGTPTIRLAQSFLYLSNGRDYFFPTTRPVFDRDEAFDGAEAGRRAAAALAEFVATTGRA